MFQANSSLTKQSHIGNENLYYKSSNLNSKGLATWWAICSREKLDVKMFQQPHPSFIALNPLRRLAFL